MYLRKVFDSMTARNSKNMADAKASKEKPIFIHPGERVPAQERGDKDVESSDDSHDENLRDVTEKKAGSGGSGEHQEKNVGDEELFEPSTGLTEAEACELLTKWGRNELEEKVTPKWLIYLQQLIQPMPIMIWIAIIIEAGIQNWIDMGLLLVIQFTNATIGWYEITKAGDAVAALKASLKPEATVKRDGKWKNINAAEVVPGDLVLLAAGSAIPADCGINHGRLEVDQSALTGESHPVTMHANGRPKMGSTAVRGEVEATVLATGMNSFFGKTASMLNQKNGLGNLAKILMRIMSVLVVMSIVLCITVMVYLLLKGQTAKQSISFAVVVLVASIPIAIEIVTTATLAIGSRSLSKHGAIVTNLSAIEELSGMNVLCSDKTGTLTLNKMVIQDDCPTYSPDQNRYTILQAAALAAKWKEPPRDALDTLTLTAADLPSLDVYEQIDFMGFDPTVKRTEGTLKGPDGKIFKTTKGAPHIIAKLLGNSLEEEDIKKKVTTKVTELGERGIRCLGVARTHPDDINVWIYLGILTFLDPPRPDTKDTIEKSLALGVDVKMITGDHTVIAKETLRQLGMGTKVGNTEGIPPLQENGQPPKDAGRILGSVILETDGFAEVFPEHKFVLVEAFRQQGFATGMTGDGVNDAPALKRADVGIAVSGATDAARAAADIVLTQEGLGVIVHAIVIARQIFKRIQSFITYRISATLQLLYFFFLGVFIFRPNEMTPNSVDVMEFEENLSGTNATACQQWNAATNSKGYNPNPLPAGCNNPWEEYYFFQLPVLLLMIITILNDGTLITIGYDSAVANKRPDKWNLKVLWTVSVVLGTVACASSLLLLWMCLDSNSVNSWFHALKLPGLRYGQITTAIFLKVSVSDFLTLFSARTYPGPFFSSMPGKLLLIGGVCALSLSTIIACSLPEGELDDVPIEGLMRTKWYWPFLIWAYCIIWWFVQDALKCLTYYTVYRYNLFGSVSSQAVNVRSVHHPKAKESACTARQSIAMVENKIFMRKIDAALVEIDKALAKPTLSDNDRHILAKIKDDLETMKSLLVDRLKYQTKNKDYDGISTSKIASRASVYSIRAGNTGLARSSVVAGGARRSVATNARRSIAISSVVTNKNEGKAYNQDDKSFVAALKVSQCNNVVVVGSDGHVTPLTDNIVLNDVEKCRVELAKVTDINVVLVVEAALQAVEQAAVNVVDVVEVANSTSVNPSVESARDSQIRV